MKTHIPVDSRRRCGIGGGVTITDEAAQDPMLG